MYARTNGLPKTVEQGRDANKKTTRSSQKDAPAIIGDIFVLSLRRFMLRMRSPSCLVKIGLCLCAAFYLISTLEWRSTLVATERNYNKRLSTFRGKFAPRMLRILDEDGDDLGDIRTLIVFLDFKMPHRFVTGLSFQHYIEKSAKGIDSPLTRETCEIADWQASHRPTCNNFHELDWLNFIEGTQENLLWISNGAYRDVWMVREPVGGRLALKTLLYDEKREFDIRNFDRHRRDAVAFEALTKSPYIANIYGYCSNSALFDFCTEGDLFDVFDDDPSKKELLAIAYRVAQSVADAHNFDSRGRPTIAHTDIKPDQWIKIDGEYKLNDFNRARLLAWDTEANEVCPFEVGKNAGKWRAPEEYNYEDETEKVDVFALGNVLYFLLTRETPFMGMKSKEAMAIVRKGGHAKVKDKRILKSKHRFEKSMLKAMEMCFVVDPSKRPGAQEVANVLKKGLAKLKS
jgi:hypothetical protein